MRASCSWTVPSLARNRAAGIPNAALLIVPGVKQAIDWHRQEWKTPNVERFALLSPLPASACPSGDGLLCFDAIYSGKWRVVVVTGPKKWAKKGQERGRKTATSINRFRLLLCTIFGLLQKFSRPWPRSYRSRPRGRTPRGQECPAGKAIV